MIEAKYCPLCGSEDHEELKLPDEVNKTGAPWRLCFCGYIFMSPQKSMEEFAEYYKQDYRDDDYPNEHDDEIQRERADRQLAFLHQTMPVTPFRVLDIGCATGVLLEVFKKRYRSDLMGIEFCERDLEILTEKRIPYQTKLEDLPDQLYDLITMSHLIEHIDKPVEYLTNLKQYMKPKGYVFLEIPSQLAKSAYEDFHYSVFSPETLARTLTLAGIVPLTGKLHGLVEGQQPTLLSMLGRLP